MIFTGDEIRISPFTPETKQQSMHWLYSGSRVKTKFKRTLSVRKGMFSVFWDRKSILFIDFLPCSETVNADRYCEKLWELRRAIQNKRLGMLTVGVVLLHGNFASCWIIRPTPLILLPAIFTFSYSSRSSCPAVSVLVTTKS
ncbi:uncharacterized protein TNCV_393861 [Trichonephila clavipes]|nr:uncharacterized protein TNCV_393861 [Trichonephila clavipes]